MRLFAFAFGSAGCLSPSGAGAHMSGPPLYNPALLNIGFVCQWQPRCMDRQESAMDHALKFVRKYRPPTWRIQLCNHNASRVSARVDWIGFSNCIRNAALQQPPSPPPPPPPVARELTGRRHPGRLHRLRRR